MACSPSPRLLLLVALFIGASTCAAIAPAHAAERCVQCHLGAGDEALRLPAEQFLGSAHRGDAIGCVACHGGDPADPTARAHASELGFVGRPRGEAAVALCGQCHADLPFMRRLNATLRTDQLELFRASRHGELAAASDPASPDCVGCHGSHDIRSGSDPSSELSPLRVSAMCGQCHADSARMAGFRTPTTAPGQWERSVHALALRQGKPNAPSCTGCHGAHADVTAGAESAARACGHCHEPELQAMGQGLHSKPFVARGLGPCVPCHGAHDIQRTEPLLLGVGPDGACARCHPREDKARATIERLGEMVRSARDRAAVARARAARASATRRVEPVVLLAGLDATELALGPLIHAADDRALGATCALIEAEATALERALDRIDGERRLKRVVTLVALGLLAVLFALVLVLAARRGRRAVP